MKLKTLCFICLFAYFPWLPLHVFAEDEYRQITPIHDQKELRALKKESLERRDKTLKEIQNITNFLKDFETIVRKHEEALRLFNSFFSAHSASIDSSKAIAEKYEQQLTGAGLNEVERKLWKDLFKLCREDLEVLSIAFSGIEDLYPLGVFRINKLKEHGNVARTYYARKVKVLAEIEALLDYYRSVQPPNQ